MPCRPASICFRSRPGKCGSAVITAPGRVELPHPFRTTPRARKLHDRRRGPSLALMPPPRSPIFDKHGLFTEEGFRLASKAGQAVRDELRAKFSSLSAPPVLGCDEDQRPTEVEFRSRLIRAVDRA